MTTGQVVLVSGNGRGIAESLAWAGLAAEVQEVGATVLIIRPGTVRTACSARSMSWRARTLSRCGWCRLSPALSVFPRTPLE
jgi:hypothetical protein